MNRFQILFIALWLLAGFAYGAEPPATAPVFKLEGEITPDSAGLLVALIRAVSVAKPPEMVLVINSPGGANVAGFQIVNALRTASRAGTTVTCVVTGKAESFAAVLFEAACSRRVMGRGSWLTFHETFFTKLPAPPSGKFDRAFLQSKANEIEDANKQVAVLIAWRMNMRADEYVQWISGHDRRVDAAEAVAKGLADAVAE